MGVTLSIRGVLRCLHISAGSFSNLEVDILEKCSLNCSALIAVPSRSLLVRAPNCLKRLYINPKLPVFAASSHSCILIPPVLFERSDLPFDCFPRFFKFF